RLSGSHSDIQPLLTFSITNRDDSVCRAQSGAGVNCITTRKERIGIGGGLTASPLPHHRTYGSVYGDSAEKETSSVVLQSGKFLPIEEIVGECKAHNMALAHTPRTVACADRAGCFRFWHSAFH